MRTAAGYHVCTVGTHLAHGHMGTNGCGVSLANHRSGTVGYAMLHARRCAGVNLLSPLAKLGQSRDLAEDIKAGRQRCNKEIIAAFEKIQTFDEIHYRKMDRPWELVPRYAKRRVSDLCGVLTSEDRMEIEQAIDKMQSLCEADLLCGARPHCRLRDTACLC
uniref:Uncharacterized protein n=1 Tax=Trypanosoma vivax (strain Y486) TaxID=1055687 RepID=G0TSK9_TRYVY|nr:conserved hypothetical protein [Trypanosoma vivax Y486]